MPSSKHFRLMEWIRFLFAMAAGLCVIIAVLDAPRRGMYFFGGGALMLMAGTMTFFIRLPFAVHLILIGTAFISIASGSMSFVFMASLALTVVTRADMLRIRKLRREGLLSRTTSNQDKLVLLRENDVGHRIWRWLKRS